MTTGEFLARATARLAEAGIETPRLDCLVLLEDELGQTRASLLAHLDDRLASRQLATLEAAVAHREKHEPLAYIRGHAPFYGRDFVVSQHVLVPRPETEVMITLLKTLRLPPSPIIADIGTGSGCLAISAKLELPDAQVHGSDVSAEALAVARQNATLLHANVEFFVSDLLANLRTHYDVLLANLPYVPEHGAINKAACHEPALALFAGSDGLDVFRAFWQQIAALSQRPAFILTESMPSQHHTMALLARADGFALEAREGFAQVFSSAL